MGPPGVSGGLGYERKIALWTGLDSVGFTEYAARIMSNRISGVSHVCLREVSFHRRKNDRARRRLECDFPLLSDAPRCVCRTYHRMRSTESNVSG